MEKDDLSEYQKRKEYLKEYRKKNIETLRKYHQKYRKEYRKKNIEKTKEYDKRENEKRKEYFYEYNEKNKENFSLRNKEYYLKNKEKRKEYFEKHKEKKKEHNKQNIDKIKLNSRNSYNRRFNADPLYRLTRNVRGLIQRSIKRNKFSKNSSTIQILGCSFEEFKIHLENNFEPWMNWENYGKYNGEFNHGWDIDHIVPSSSAKCEEDIYKLNHYTNLQPLCSKINRYIKKDNYEKDVESSAGVYEDDVHYILNEFEVPFLIAILDSAEKHTKE